MNPVTPIPPHGSRPALAASTSMRLLASALAALVAACGDAQDPASPAVVPITVPGSASQVEARVGEATVTVVAIQTSQLTDQVAAQEGVEQRDDLVMLRVSPRKGPLGSETTAPVDVRATATGLRGDVHDIVMVEKPVAGLVDHVGLVQVTLPDTLRFDVTVVTPQGESEALQFVREFHAR